MECSVTLPAATQVIAGLSSALRLITGRTEVSLVRGTVIPS